MKIIKYLRLYCNMQEKKHLHKKMVKYNKKKHKKCIWMTNGLLTSINTKDNLYKILMQTDTTNVELFNILKEEFKVYRATLRKGIREAKRMYYRRTFHLYKNNVKKTWALINSTLNRKTKAQTITEIKFNNNTVFRIQMTLHTYLTITS